MKAYEIHVFRSGRWVIDSVFDDQDLAVIEAQRMNGSGRYPGLRVVEEVFDEHTSETRTRTVYRDSRSSRAAPAQPPAAERKRSAAARGRGRADTLMRPPREGAMAVSAGPGGLRLAVILGGVAIIGLGALIGLRYLQDML
jgi:hypothetical protein